ncbi:hypothetical protein DFA_01683 [Cavenderia fasciculata]|uniref:Uncharacterized protein n=1 Tax=Cavenderia fasciculata TaxID=261658 RepID=F4PU82_CACFS|nr:uncharacterized protein DFA_01683 [Cavenderia fasciculata]EGG21797.1 hypothetical protein DFA_01683 [Cavenderia fasciculata]|eukprot:XP_004359647.1 hypothetical protein DFA_01683 [Cavenderia fasciculata]
MSKPTSDVVYGLDNDKRRTFLPSTDNTFGGYPIPYVMLDTGCNSHLLSIPEMDGLSTLFNTFPTKHPNAAGEQFTYKIKSGGGVAALQSPVLSVYNNAGNAFTIRLCSDLYPHELIHNEYLRFSLCYDDVVGILSAVDSAQINSIKAIIPGINIAKRRRHALLGRSLIGVGGRQMRFIRDLTIISANSARVSPSPQEVDEILNICTNFVSNNSMGMQIFNDLEDDYLIEIPHDDEKLDS